MLSWPAHRSADSISDLQDWLKIVERKIMRSEKAADSAEEPTTWPLVSQRSFASLSKQL